MPATASLGPGYISPELAAQLAAKCPVVGDIGSYFLIPAGSTVQSIFPNGGKTPELDGKDGLFVVVYAGNVRLPSDTGGGTSGPGSSPQPSTFSNVVCVVPPAGEVEVYEDVDERGIALPPGAQRGPLPSAAPSPSPMVEPSQTSVPPTAPPLPTLPAGIPTAAPVPQPTRPPSPISLDWTRLDQSQLPAFGAIYDVTAGRNRFLAYASGGLFASADGIDWTMLGPAPGQVYDDPRGLFAFGSPLTNHGSKAELWWSADGSSWESLTDQPAFSSSACPSADDPIVGIYPIGGSLIAVGSNSAWSSTDGQTWQCLGPVPELRFSGGHNLLVGSGNPDPQTGIDYLWLSRDGTGWQPMTETADFMNPAPVATGFVALGQSFHSPPGVLLNAMDGVHWVAHPVPFGSEVLNETVPLASDGSRAIVVEDAPDFTSESPGDVWVSSTDGSSWARYPLPRHRSDYAIAAAILGSQVVVFGDDEAEGGSDNLIWTATVQ